MPQNATDAKRRERPYLTVEEGVVLSLSDPLLVPGLAEELLGSVLGLVLGEVKAEGLERNSLGNGDGRAGGDGARRGEGYPSGNGGNEQDVGQGSHGFGRLTVAESWRDQRVFREAVR